MPEEIFFPKWNEKWSVIYKAVPEHCSMIRELGERNLLLQTDGHTEYELLVRWLCIRGRELMTPLVESHARACGVKITGLSVKNVRSRWGSCSSKGRVNLNVRLLFLPGSYVDYVIIHELCHRLHFDHSDKFWASVSRHVPEYRAIREEMKHALSHIPPWMGGTHKNNSTPKQGFWSS